MYPGRAWCISSACGAGGPLWRRVLGVIGSAWAMHFAACVNPASPAEAPGQPSLAPRPWPLCSGERGRTSHITRRPGYL